jgi:beta-glucosidase
LELGIWNLFFCCPTKQIMKRNFLKFPTNFYWGTATASHQVEGGNHNDWTIWEHKNAKRLAEESEGKYSWIPAWDDVKDMAKDRRNYISDIATDHYHRYEEDFDIMRSLGLNAYRFSIEWSRIEPKEGEFDKKEIAHYRRFIQSLRKRGIEPFVTLWHWPIPVWLREKGGWENKDVCKYFARYAEKMANTLGKDVKFWITLNEPTVYTNLSYLAGMWVPQKKSLFASRRVLKNLSEAHNQAYKLMKHISPEFQIGISHNCVYFDVKNDNFFNKIGKKVSEQRLNHSFIKKVQNAQDFIGLNYYFRNKINLFGFLKGFSKFISNPEKYAYDEREDNTAVSDIGWELYPKGLYHILTDLNDIYNKPIYITEHGVADGKDQYRSTYLKESLKEIHKAIEEGVDIRGYMHWTFMDNFEWDKGRWPRFGLVEIDYENDLKRKLRPSALEYAKIIKENGLYR